MNNLILPILFFLCVEAFSQQAKQIDLPISGELSKTISSDEKKSLQHLILTGKIDARDIKCLRDEFVSLQKLDISNAYIIEYEGKNGTLPFNEYADYKTNELPPYSFNNYAAGKATLKSIYLPNSIIKIDQNAFKQCKNLEEITIPATVNVIGESAFSDCVSIKLLFLPASLTRIESNAFSNYEQITSIKLPFTLEFIGKSAFRNCYNLTNVVFENKKLTISESAFAFCSELKNIYCIGEFPPIVATTAFELTSIHTVFVPATALKIYMKDSFWGSLKIAVNQ